jgi:hypothetical protein
VFDQPYINEEPEKIDLVDQIFYRAPTLVTSDHKKRGPTQESWTPSIRSRYERILIL